jgi:hypothetical protein
MKMMFYFCIAKVAPNEKNIIRIGVDEECDVRQMVKYGWFQSTR